MTDNQLSQAGHELLRRRLGGEAPVVSDLLGWRRSARPPLSFGQRRLWFISRMADDTFAYHVPVAWRLRGALNVPALQRAIELVTHRHESLRTRFSEEGGEPFQVIDDCGNLALAVSDLSGVASAETAAHAIVEAEAERRFDLERGPLLRANLICLGRDDHVLALVVHHIVFDRASLNIWGAEVSRAYSGHPLHPTALPVQYADFADWQKATASETALAGQLAYWHEQLSDAPLVLELPFDRPRPRAPLSRAGFVDFQLPADTVIGLRRLAREHRASLFAVALTAYQGVLARYAGAEHVLVGCPATGRTQAVLEGIIGFFVNSLPIRADLRDDPPLGVLLRRTHSTLLAAHAHQDTPFDRIVDELAPAREAGRNPIFQVWFDLIESTDGATPGELSLSGLKASPWDTGRVRTRFDLELHLVAVSADTVTGRLQYAENLFRRETVVALAEHYCNFLTALARSERQRVSMVEMLSPHERELLVSDWGTGSGWQDD